MDNIIQNEKTKVPTGIKLNDKDYLNCLLSCLKELVKNYSVVLTEASNQTLYNTYKIMFDKYSSLQREAYLLSFKLGWYTLEPLESNKINNKFQMLNKEYQDLNI